MNMKAIMFAGSGLFLSMVATTMWISADMADIKARELAKRQAECAQQFGAPATAPSVPSAPGAASIETTTTASDPNAYQACVDGTSEESAAPVGEVDALTGEAVAEDPAFGDIQAESTFDDEGLETSGF